MLGNKAQVSTEYLVILSIIGILVVVATAFAFNIIKIRDVAKIENNLYKRALLKMI